MKAAKKGEGEGEQVEQANAQNYFQPRLQERETIFYRKELPHLQTVVNALKVEGKGLAIQAHVA
ncbi:MAG: hypothetical protein HC915_01245 [Anaerolineae bacterium]|nr:hypothetical protein [Anaerolineae bacterium]